MEAKDKLNELFEHLRNEKPETEISEITQWLSLGKANPPAKSIRKINKTKFIIIMSTITTMLLSGILIVQTASKQTKTSKPEMISDLKQTENALNEHQPNFERARSAEELVLSERVATDQQSIERKADYTAFNWQEPQDMSEKILENTNNNKQIETGLGRTTEQGSGETNVKKSDALIKERVWVSVEDKLSIDTLFDGIKKVVFDGEGVENIVIRRNAKSEIRMNYKYKAEIKGLHVRRKREGDGIELHYQIKDSVLNIQLINTNENFIMIGFSKTENLMEFSIPDNTELDFKTENGDVEFRGLSGSKYKIKTTYGKIQVSDILGVIDLNSSYGGIKIERLNGESSIKTSYGNIHLNQFGESKCQIETNYGNVKGYTMKGKVKIKSGYGDVTLEDIEGELTVKTTHGNINGDHITARGDVDLLSSYGNINMQLANPDEELKYDLETTYGDASVEKNPENNGRGTILKFGKGNKNISAKTSYGHIRIR